MKFFTKQFYLFVMVFVFTSISAYAQVTTAAINGMVTDDSGEALIAATVVAVHTPSGTQYGTTTRDNGSFTLPNLRVGGPYQVVVSYIGNESQTLNNINLSLAQKLTLDFVLSSAAVNMDEIVVTAKGDDILNSERTGASTNIGGEQLTKLPTISRSTSDFYRLEPSASGSSFGGRNNKMNNFTLDGSIFNNPFGLDAATPGSQTNAQPVSLDAIAQIQVNIAPYDVTQAGFTGAAVNAVTKSGTNTFKGSVYGFYRNQDMTGSKVNGVSFDAPDLTHAQTGISIGGPIIKNKLFFFANAEIERRGDLATAFVARKDGDVVGGNVSRVLESDLIAVSDALKGIGYETGAYEGYTHRTDNQKAMLKLDWNVSKNTTLTATYNILDATRDKPGHPSALGRRGPDQTTLQFANSGYQIRNYLQSSLVEVKTIFGNNASNFFQAGWTGFKDSRDPNSAPAPVISIRKDGTNYIIAGHEPFSVHNRLNQDVYQVTDNVTIYKGNHTITVGASFEKFAFDNSFNLGNYAGTFGPGYDSPQAFLDSVANGVVSGEILAAQANFDKNGGDDGELGKGWALAETNVGQFGVYIQDEMNFGDVTVTAGVRVDKPLYFDTKTKIEENLERAGFAYIPDATYSDEKGNIRTFDQTVLPGNAPLISPRVGFNYDVLGDKSMQLRGGSGLFTGRFPFVWLGNQVANPNWFFYCVTHPDFKFPQVWRNNLGYDVKLRNGFTISADVVYTKDVNAMMVRNYGIKPPTGELKGVDNRPIYSSDDDANDIIGFGFRNNAYVFTTTDVGRSFNMTLQVKKDFDNGLHTSLGYNYQDSKDASSIPAEISGDAYARNPAFGNVNEAVLAPSLYGHKHRVVGSVYKQFDFWKGNPTSIAVFFEYVQGGRFSYVYGGDVNNDGSGQNDLIYIPTTDDVNNMNFDETNNSASDQRAALEAYIEQDDYLNAKRGEYAGKYSVLSPWYNDWDLRIAQDVMLKGKTGFQLTLDVLNVGNMLNSKWGVRQNPTNPQAIGVAVDGDSNPTYSFDTDLKSTFSDDFSLLSRWQMQIGLRFSF